MMLSCLFDGGGGCACVRERLVNKDLGTSGCELIPLPCEELLVTDGERTRYIELFDSDVGVLMERCRLRVLRLRRLMEPERELYCLFLRNCVISCNSPPLIHHTHTIHSSTRLFGSSLHLLTTSCCTRLLTSLWYHFVTRSPVTP